VSGWNVKDNLEFLTEVVERFCEAGIRTSIFIAPDVETVKLVVKTGTDRVEFYTKPYADMYATDRERAVAPYVEASQAAHNVGLGVNAGHDLNLENLEFFHQSMPYLNEVSIGHAIICDALYLGLKETIARYKACLGR
jgi:pyridoxine 5-phosphate synthase